MSLNQLANRVLDMLTAMAWVARHINYGKDADDYLQTTAIAQSLIENQKLSLIDIVSKWRSPLHRKIGGGLQFEALLNSPLAEKYRATDGITTRACMRVLPLVVFFLEDQKAMLQAVQEVTLLTHHSPEAVLSAILIALRYRQVLQGQENPEQLVENFEHAISYLNIERASDFFYHNLQKGLALWKEYVVSQDEIAFFQQLFYHIGITHMAWALPITVTWASYGRITHFPLWLNPTLWEIKNKKHLLEPNTWQNYQKYLSLLRHDGKYNTRYGHKWKEHTWVDADWDTFMILLYSLLAGRIGTQSIDQKLPSCQRFLGYDLQIISEKLCFFALKSQ